MSSEKVNPITKLLGAHDSVTETIRSCYADYLMGYGTYSEFSLFTVRRILKSKLLFSSLKNFCAEYMNLTVDSVESVENKIPPHIFAAITASFFISRKALKVSPKSQISFIGSRVSVVSSISETLGSYIPEIGLFHATLFGAFLPSSLAILANDNLEKFANLVEHLESQSLLTDTSYENRLFKTNLISLASELLVRIGFGRRLGEQFLLGCSTDNPEGTEAERFSNLLFWVGLFLKEEPGKYITKENFVMDDKLIDEMLEKIKSAKETPRNPWFMPEFAGMSFQFAQDEEDLDETLSFD